MKQRGLAHIRFELVTKRTYKRVFLDEMNLVIPWSELLALIAPLATVGKTGGPSFLTEVMLRIHLCTSSLVTPILRLMQGQRKAMDKSKPFNVLREQLGNSRPASGPRWSIDFE